MDCHVTARGSIPGQNDVFIEFHILRKGQLIGMPSLNDLTVDGMLNTTNQLVSQKRIIASVLQCIETQWISHDQVTQHTPIHKLY